MSLQVDYKHKLNNLKDRLAKYKLKNELVTQRELEREAKIIQNEELEKENKSRLEAEKQALVQELQKAPTPDTPPAQLHTLQLNMQQQLIQQQQQQQLQLQQSFFGAGAFTYPAIVTEKEAIDWLRNGL